MKRAGAGDRLRQRIDRCVWTVALTGRTGDGRGVCLMHGPGARGLEWRWVSEDGLRYFEAVEERRAA